MQQTQQQLLERLEAYQRPFVEAYGSPSSQPGGGQIDPDDYLTAGQTAAFVEQQMAGYRQMEAQQRNEAAAAQVDSYLDELAKRDGEFNREIAFGLAERMLDEANREYPGQPEQAVAVALDRGAARARELEAEYRKAGVEDWQNTITRIGEAPREAPVGATGGVVHQSGPIKGGDEMSVVRKYGGLG